MAKSRGKKSQGQWLRKSLLIVDTVFKEAKNSRFSFHTKKKSMDDSTIKTYQEAVEAILRKVYEAEKIGDIFRMKVEHVEKIIREMPNISSAKKAAHAMSFFQRSMEQGHTVKDPPELISRDKKGNLQILNEFREAKRFRRASETSVMKATREQVETIIQRVQASRAENKIHTVAELKLESMVGTRVTETCALRAQDIRINENGTATVHVDSRYAKGGRSRDVGIRNKDAVDYLKTLKEQAPRPESFLVPRLARRNGNLYDIEGMAKAISNTINEAGEKSGVREIRTENGKEIEVFFSSHSARKCFASEMLAEYKSWSEPQLLAEIQHRIEENREIRRIYYTYSDYQKKWDTLRHRINYGAHGTRRTSEWREPNHKEMEYFLASLDIGHARIDVMRYYV